MDAATSNSFPIVSHSLPVASQVLPLAASPSHASSSSSVEPDNSEKASLPAQSEEDVGTKDNNTKRKAADQTNGVSATICANCGTTTTPLWRRAPNGDTICNACGLYFKARNQFRPPTLKRANNRKPPAEAVSDCGGGSCPGGGQCNGTGGSESCAGCPAYNQHQVNRQALICFNCQTTTTPLWRRDDAGNTICNACGLYYKLHNMHRPVSMKRSVIKRRKRIIVAGSEGNEDDNQEKEKTGDEAAPVVHKRRVKASADKKNKRRRGLSNKETQASEQQDDSILPVPAIEDYIVPKRAKLPSEMASAAPPPMQSPQSTVQTRPEAATAPSQIASPTFSSEQKPPTPLLPPLHPENLISRPPPTSPPSLPSTPTSNAALSPPLGFRSRDGHTLSLPPISPERRGRQGIDYLLNNTSSSPSPRVALSPISLAYMQPEPSAIRRPSFETDHPVIPSIFASPLSHIEPRNIAEIDAAMNRLAELRRQMTAASDEQ